MSDTFYDKANNEVTEAITEAFEAHRDLRPMKYSAGISGTPEWYSNEYREKVLDECAAIAVEYGLKLEELKRHAPVLWSFVNGSPAHYGKALRELCQLVAVAKLAQKAWGREP